MGTPSAIRLCLQSAMTGFYFRVIQEGMIEAGVNIVCEFVNQSAPTVDDVHRLYFLDKDNVEGLKKASRCSALEAGWTKSFAARLEKLGVSPD
jgi:MOSC domain-containing protein YiiM